MKKDRYCKQTRKLNNAGFSLVELLISIAVLVIIMVPLMSNFIQSMRMNSKAEKLQLQSNQATSILEGFKASGIKDIIQEFNGLPDNFNLIPDKVDDVMRLVKDGSGNFIRTNFEDEQDTYYFAIHGIDVGSTAYDAFIKLEAAPYKVNVGTMNNYPMPEPINLDEKANGLFFSDGTSVGDYESSETPSSTELDDSALTSFVLWGTEYAQRMYLQSPEYLAYLDAYDRWMDAKMDGDPSDAGPEPTPPSLAASGLEIYTNPEEIKKIVTKTMTVTVTDKRIQYQVEYLCNWWLGSENIQDSITQSIDDISFAQKVENVYLFYSPSIFQASHKADSIILQNNNIVNPIKLFIAKQGDTIITYPMAIRRLSVDDNISVFTNVALTNSYIGASESGSVIPQVVNTKNEDRIFEVTVNICKSEAATVLPADRYKSVLYSMKSTKEK